MAKRLKIVFAILILLSISAGGATFAQSQKVQPKTRILFLFDASGSMLAKWENSDRMSIAKSLLTHLADSLERYENVEVALRIYGHQSGREQNDCQDTKLEVPFAPKNSKAIKRKLDHVTPRGNTPITYSLLQSANDFPDTKSRNVIILITDGLESCNGDPCAVSLALQKKRVFLRPFIIGIGIAPEYDQQLNCIGQYFNAADVRTFERVLAEIVKHTLSETTVSVELLDEQNRAVETNVNMTFINSITGDTEYNYVHYQNGQGRTDILDIDALIPYNLVVNTTPPVVAHNLPIIPGQHNVVRVKAPQGELYLRQDGTLPYGQLLALVRERGSDNTLNAQAFGSKHKYLTGRYDLEILTLPRIYLRDQIITQGQTRTVVIPPPGQLVIPVSMQGYGSIYEVDESGKQTLIYTLPEDNSKLTMAMQPGNYRLVYRLKSAQASKFTDVQDFAIKSGATTTVKIFNR